MKLIEQYRNMEAQANSYLPTKIGKTFEPVIHNEYNMNMGEWQRISFFKITTVTVPCKRKGKAIKTREMVVVQGTNDYDDIVGYALRHIPLEIKLLICDQLGL